MWGRRWEAAVSAEVGLLGWYCIGCLSSLHPPPPPPRMLRARPSSHTLIPLSSPKPKPPHGLHLGQEPHPPPGSWACRSGTVSHPAAHCFPLLLVRMFTRPIHCSLFPLSLSPPLSSALFCPLLFAWPFLQGSLHLAHLSLPSSLRVSGAALGALAPAPSPSLLSFLLSWKVQSPVAGWVGGEESVL